MAEDLTNDPPKTAGAGQTVDPAKEEAYWREQHSKQPYAAGKPFEDFAPAYRTGIHGALKHFGKTYEEIEDDLALDYEKHDPYSPIPWDEARPAVKATWERMVGILSPLNPTRGVRYDI